MLSDGHSKINYGKIEFTYDNKEKADIVEWTEKRIDKEICVYLQRHLNAQSITPPDIEGVQVVVGGDHGDMAFQLGAFVSVQLFDNRIIHFELVCCELICRKDTAKLIRTNNTSNTYRWAEHYSDVVSSHQNERRGSDIVSIQANTVSKYSPC
jgi:hypothetical protein